jgi:hypothetical protein
MKFALLVATTAAVRISSMEDKGPSCGDIWGMVTKHCDKDHDESISWKEARGCGAPKEAKDDFEAAAGSDGEVDKDEFMEECHKHMKGGKGLAEVSVEGGHCKRMAAAIWKHCDKDGDKHISWGEAKACGAPPAWKPKFLEVAGKDKEVDHKEFMDACKAHGGLAEEEEEVEGGHCKRMAAAIWKHCDKDGDKHISWKEARGCGAPKHWKPQFMAVAGEDKEVDHAEFMDACKAHGGLAEEAKGPNCGDIWGMVRKHCDKDHDKTISWKEASACGAPKDFEPAFKHIAGKDGVVDKGEFMEVCHKHM